MATPRPYVRPRTVQLLADAVLLIGVVLAVAGVAYAANGATQARGEVEVPVTLASPEGAAGVPIARADLPAGSRLETPADRLVLRVTDSTVTEQLASRGDLLLIGLAAGAGGLLLRRLLLSVADGRPFEPANARRIAVGAGLVALAGTLGPTLPQLAAVLVLDRLGLTGPGGPFEVGVSFDLWPLLVTPVLLALAEAFRRGAELADDVHGLV